MYNTSEWMLRIFPSLVIIIFSHLQSQPQQVFTITENRPINYAVTNLSLEVEKAFPMVASQRYTGKDYNFIITNARDRGPDCFTIDEETILRVVKNIDRDEICPRDSPFPSILDYQQQANSNYRSSRVFTTAPDDLISGVDMKACSVDMKIAFFLRKSIIPRDRDSLQEEQRELKTMEIHIRIEDENDNDPKFPMAQVNIEYSEFSYKENDVLRQLPKAIDPDAGPNGELTYWIDDYVETENKTSSMRVENPFNLSGPPLQLVLTRPLDWETVQKYQIPLRVRDNGKPARSSSMLINVNVIDENDWQPKFSKGLYQGVINESFKEFTTILEIQAQDRDGNENGKVTFSMAPPRNFIESESIRYFGIRSTGANTASIYLQKAIDLDQEKIHLEETLKQTDTFNNPFKSKLFTFRIIVRDNGLPKRLSSEADVKILLLDVNDVQPLITVTYMSSKGDPKVGTLEEATQRSFIAFVSVEDADSGSWGEVKCHTDNDAFELETSSNPDDDDPTINLFLSRSSVNFNRKYEYKLYSNKPFDREETFEVTFKIFCVDNPRKVGSAYVKENSNTISFTRANGVQLTGSTMVRVQILDVNDNPPKFLQTSYEFIINESNNRLDPPDDRNIHIGTIKAIDADLKSEFTYTISADPMNAFQVDNKTGIVFLTKRVDRESLVMSKMNGYHGSSSESIFVNAEESVVVKFKGHVTDQRFEATCDITVIIKDVNDCQPVFDLNEYIVEISESHPLVSMGEQALIRAVDCDSKIFSKIFYQIQYINDGQSDNYHQNQQFRIDSMTGQLYLIKPLDREKQEQYRFYVVANDFGGNSHSSSYYNNKNYDLSHEVKTLVTINVLDENDNAPVIINPTRQSQIIVKSNSPAGFKVFNVIASDPDKQENSTITYQLKQVGLNIKRTTGNESNSNVTDNESLFTIDEVTGVVYLTRKMPEIVRDYYLQLVVHDSGHVISRNSSQTVIVKVVDELYADEMFLNQEALLEQGGDANGREKTNMFLSDRTIVILLASIFIILLLTTITLLMLIRKRRRLEMQRLVPINGYKLNLNSSMNNQEQAYLRSQCLDPSTNAKTIYRLSRLPIGHTTTMNDYTMEKPNLAQSVDNLFLTNGHFSPTNVNTFDKQKSLSPNREISKYQVYPSNEILNQDYSSYMTMYQHGITTKTGSIRDYQMLQRDPVDLTHNRMIDNKFRKSTELLDNSIKLNALHGSCESPSLTTTNTTSQSEEVNIQTNKHHLMNLHQNNTGNQSAICTNESQGGSSFV